MKPPAKNKTLPKQQEAATSPVWSRGAGFTGPGPAWSTLRPLRSAGPLTCSVEWRLCGGHAPSGDGLDSSQPPPLPPP